MLGDKRRSDACKTCRARRVKCDATKPACQRCLKGGRICEGYSNELIFMNKTLDGPKQKTEATLQNPHDPEVAWLASRSSGMPNQLSLTAVTHRRIEGLFLEKYLARDHSETRPSPGGYILEAMKLPRSWILEPAIRALCMTRVGRFTDDDRLTHLGGQAYLLALRRMRNAVSKSKGSSQEGIFAAIALLHLHELYEPTGGNMRGFYDHTTGLASMIASQRGQPLTAANKSLLEFARYISMTNSIASGKRSPLARSDWSRRRPNTSLVDFQQGLYDIGIEIGGLHGDLNLDSDDENWRILLIERLGKIESGLQEWYSSLLIFLPNPAFSAVESQDFASGNTKKTTFEFPSLAIANTFMEYWALQILFYTNRQRFRQKFGHATKTTELEQQLEQERDTAALIEYAQNIESAISYCCKPDMGYIGQQKTMFPIRSAIVVYRSNPEYHQWAKNLIEVMNGIRESCGLQLANILSRRPPQGTQALVIEKALNRWDPADGQGDSASAQGNPANVLLNPL